MGRTPVFSQTDMTIMQNVRLFRHTNVTFEANVINLFDQAIVSSYFATPYRSGGTASSTPGRPARPRASPTPARSCSTQMASCASGRSRRTSRSARRRQVSSLARLHHPPDAIPIASPEQFFAGFDADAIAAATPSVRKDPRFGLANGWQGARSVRFAAKFRF